MRAPCRTRGPSAALMLPQPAPEAFQQLTGPQIRAREDEPRLFFMHVWANDDTGMLAQGLGAALRHVKIGRS